MSQFNLKDKVFILYDGQPKEVKIVSVSENIDNRFADYGVLIDDKIIEKKEFELFRSLDNLQSFSIWRQKQSLINNRKN